VLVLKCRMENACRGRGRGGGMKHVIEKWDRRLQCGFSSYKLNGTKVKKKGGMGARRIEVQAMKYGMDGSIRKEMGVGGNLNVR